MTINPDKEAFARELQENPTASERILKRALEKKGYHFHFNQVLYGYIPDYYFPQHNKIVELDGKQFHDAERDKARDAAFLAYGIQTFRIRSYRVFGDLKQVLRSIDIFLGRPVKKKKAAKRARAKAKAQAKAQKKRSKNYVAPAPRFVVPKKTETKPRPIVVIKKGS